MSSNKSLTHRQSNNALLKSAARLKQKTSRKPTKSTQELEPSDHIGTQEARGTPKGSRSVFLIAADEDLQMDMDIGLGERREDDAVVKQQSGKFTRLVKTISCIRPIMKKDIVDVDG